MGKYTDKGTLLLPSYIAHYQIHFWRLTTTVLHIFNGELYPFTFEISVSYDMGIPWNDW